MYKEYRKTASVKAKIFQEGDQDGFIIEEGIESKSIPYISTLENQFHKGEFEKNYICIGVKGEKWLIEKEIFESTYEEVK